MKTFLGESAYPCRVAPDEAFDWSAKKALIFSIFLRVCFIIVLFLNEKMSDFH